MPQGVQERQRVLHQEHLEAPRVEGKKRQPILPEHAWLPALREPFFNKPGAEVVQPVGTSQTTSVKAIEWK